MATAAAEEEKEKEEEEEEEEEDTRLDLLVDDGASCFSGFTTKAGQWAP
jgi:hypothetical protein